MDRVYHLWPDIIQLTPKNTKSSPLALTTSWVAACDCVSVLANQVSTLDDYILSSFRLKTWDHSFLHVLGTLIWAAAHGHLAMCQFISTFKPMEIGMAKPMMLWQAARNGHLDVCQFLTSIPGFNTQITLNEPEKKRFNSTLEMLKRWHLKIDDTRFEYNRNLYESAKKSYSCVMQDANFWTKRITEKIIPELASMYDIDIQLPGNPVSGLQIYLAALLDNLLELNTFVVAVMIDWQNVSIPLQQEKNLGRQKDPKSVMLELIGHGDCAFCGFRKVHGVTLDDPRVPYVCARRKAMKHGHAHIAQFLDQHIIDCNSKTSSG